MTNDELSYDQLLVLCNNSLDRIQELEAQLAALKIVVEAVAKDADCIAFPLEQPNPSIIGEKYNPTRKVLSLQDAAREALSDTKEEV